MSMENLGEKYEILANNYELLQERMDEMAQKYQELDWELLEGYDDNAGLSLDRLKQRSEEHTSELQSRGHLVCRLLLEKKKWESICSRRFNGLATPEARHGSLS